MDLAIKLIVLLPLLAARHRRPVLPHHRRPAGADRHLRALLIAAARRFSSSCASASGRRTAKLFVVELFTWIDSGHARRRLVAAGRHADRRHADRRHRRVVDGACLIRSATWPRTQHPAFHVSYLSLFTFFMLMLVTSDNSRCSCSSAGRASVSPRVSADRLLVRQAVGQRRGHQGASSSTASAISASPSASSPCGC